MPNASIASSLDPCAERLDNGLTLLWQRLALRACVQSSTPICEPRGPRLRVKPARSTPDAASVQT